MNASRMRAAVEKIAHDASALWRALAFGVVVFNIIYIPSSFLGSSEMVSAGMGFFFMSVAIMAHQHQQPLSLPWSLPFWMKRLTDVILASALLILLLPHFLIIPLLIWLESPGPIFYTSIRVGYDGRRFRLYRFRTMTEPRRPSTMWPLADDPRITRVGRLLRRTGLDGLPQLWNVIKGDMSLVGPRPIPDEWFTYLGLNLGLKVTKQRTTVVPGVIEWATLFAPITPDPTPEQQWRALLQLDAWYVRHWTLVLDLKIVLKAVGIYMSKGPGRVVLVIPDVPPPINQPASKAGKPIGEAQHGRHAPAH